MNNKIIVLITGGKNEDVYLVKIKLFDDYKLAYKHCNEVNESSDAKYWEHAEIINENKYYEVARAKNYEM